MTRELSGPVAKGASEAFSGFSAASGRTKVAEKFRAKAKAGQVEGDFGNQHSVGAGGHPSL